MYYFGNQIEQQEDQDDGTQSFNLYGKQIKELKKGSLRTDDIEGAKPKTFRKHIWGSDNRNYKKISQSAVISKPEVKNNLGNYVPEQYQSKQDLNSDKLSEQQTDTKNKLQQITQNQGQTNKNMYRNPDNYRSQLISQSNLASDQENKIYSNRSHLFQQDYQKNQSYVYNGESNYKSQYGGYMKDLEIVTSRKKDNNLLEKHEKESEEKRKQIYSNFTPTILSHKAEHIKKQFFNEKPISNQKQTLQNQLHQGILNKIQQFKHDRSSPVLETQWEVKQKHHFPQKQFYQEKLKTEDNLNYQENQNLQQNLENSKISSDSNTKKNKFLIKKNALYSSDNINKGRKEQREALQQAMENNKLHIFNNPDNQPFVKKRLHLNDCKPYKFEVPYQHVSTGIY